MSEVKPVETVFCLRGELWDRALIAEARVAELEAENARLRDEAASALALLARMRAACGDDGMRMQDELEAYLRELRADAERYRWLRGRLQLSVRREAGYWAMDADGCRYPPADSLDAAVDRVRLGA